MSGSVEFLVGLGVASAVAVVWFGVGWKACARRNLRLSERADDLEQRMDAYRHADTRTDLDVIGPIAVTNAKVERAHTWGSWAAARRQR